MSTSVYPVLLESQRWLKKKHDVNPYTKNGLLEMITRDDAHAAFVERMCDDINPEHQEVFASLCENQRLALMERASVSSLTSYDTLTYPVLRRFFPRLIAKEAVYVTTIDKPDTFLPFLKFKFGRHSDLSGQGGPVYPYEFPYIQDGRRIDNPTDFPTVDLSRGDSVGVNVEALTGSDHRVDILDLLGLDSTKAHLEKDFYITKIIDSTGGYVNVNIEIDVDNNFSHVVQFPNGPTDTLTGRVDFYNGILEWDSIDGNIDQIQFRGFASLEENRINTQVTMELEKLRMKTKLRQLQGTWPIPFEQDLKALFDLSAMSEIVNVMGEQKALETDREIIDDLIRGVLNSDMSGLRQDTFDKKFPTGYQLGPKMWLENILPKITNLSAQIYNATNMGTANIILANPVDAAIFENFNNFNFDGHSVPGGNIGYATMSLQGTKYKVLVSNVVPAGKMLLKYRAEDKQRAVYAFASYVPALLHPFPIGNNPSVTIMSRYATRMIRPEGLALLNIVDTTGQ